MMLMSIINIFIPCLFKSFWLKTTEVFCYGLGVIVLFEMSIGV